MAIDATEQLNSMYKEAQKALQQELRQNLYDAAQNRNQAFRQLNNNANAGHALYSGVPAAQQMQYDEQTFLPGTATMVQKAINQQINNQQSWDEYMEYVNKLNEQAAELENATKDVTSATPTNTTTAGGLSTNPQKKETSTTNSSSSVVQDFAGGGGGGGNAW